MYIPFGVFSAAGGGGETNSYELISTANGTGSSNIISFASIPQTYKHLQVRFAIRTAYGATTDTVYAYNFNNNTGNTGSAYHQLYGNGSGAAQSTSSTGNSSSVLGFAPGNNAVANSYGAMVLDILDYTSTTKNKTLRSFWGFVNSSDYQVGLTSNLPVTLPGTNAVTSLNIITNGNMTTATRISLYGTKG